jgi:hypothetical protein
MAGVIMSNKSLSRAFLNSNDELYTFFEDIEKEVIEYPVKEFRRKVYCNCDNCDSAFIRYFEDGGNLSSSSDDYRNHLDELGPNVTVVTNPPFSLFREFITDLLKSGCKFLIVGPLHAITYKEVWPHIMAGHIWLGVNQPKDFLTPTNEIQTLGNCVWWTNIPNTRLNRHIISTKRYMQELYPHYDNYDAIEVSRVSNIPKGYKGKMGVPISFLQRHNPKQFEILGLLLDRKGSIEHGVVESTRMLDYRGRMRYGGLINRQQKFTRIIIKPL